MKTKLILSLSALTLGVLAGCGNKQASKGTFTLSFENGNYEISGLTSGEKITEGETVNFKVSSDSVFYTIDEVSYNGEIITPSGDNYSFVMPKEDVTITVTLKEAPEIEGTEDFDWGSCVIDKFSLPKDGIQYTTVQKIPLDFDLSGKFVSDLDVTILTSNEEVIPTEAITFNKITKSTGNEIIGGYLNVDLTKLAKGSSFIYINIDPKNGSSSAKVGELSKKFEVVDFGAITLDTISATFDIDYSDVDVEPENIYMTLYDNEFIYGANGIEYNSTQIYFDTLEDGKFVFNNYIASHTYKLSFGYVVYDEDGSIDSVYSLNCDDWVGKGSSVTGYNQLVDSNLTLLEDGMTIPITLSK